MALDTASRHPPGVHGDDLVVEPLEARLALGDDDRFEGSVPVAGDGQVDLAELPLERFLVTAVP